MSRYFQNYDIHGEPRSILPSGGDPVGETDRERIDRFQREATAAVAADDLYETMRHEGASHEEARAAVKGRFGV